MLRGHQSTNQNNMKKTNKIICFSTMYNSKLVVLF